MNPKKPTESEEEYFARQEFERRKAHAEHIQKELEEKERNRLKELHHMKCPKCGMQLIEIDFKGIKIDKCSACEGVWLDHGELDQIIEADEPSLIESIFKVLR